MNTRRAAAALLTGLAVLAIGAGCGRRGGARSRPPENVLANALWDDGRAEISQYAGLTPQGGQERPTIANLIVVKEDLLRTTLVKSDSGPIPGRTLTAIKCNFTVDFRTGTYAEHEMATVMFERSKYAALKETAVHTDGCGLTFVRVGPVRGALVQQAHSYWEGEADRTTHIVPPDGALVYEDALPLWLRGWAGSERFPPELEIWLLPSQLGARAPLRAAHPVHALIRRATGDSIQVPAGRFETRVFTVETPLGRSRYWLDARFPHVLVRLENAAGRWLELRSTVRLDYWNHTRNGDQRWLDASPAP